MNLSETFNRCKLGLAGATLALGSVSGSAQALTDGDLVFVALDSNRDGQQASIALELGLDSLSNAPDFSGASLVSGALQTWLNDPNAGTITWGVFGVGNDASADLNDIRIFSTVNPVDTPAAQPLGNIFGAFSVMDTFVGKFNGEDAVDTSPMDGVVQGIQGTNGFLAQGFLPNWGTNTSFDATGPLGMLEMYAFGIDDVTAEGVDGAFQGTWTLTTQGELSYAPVPVPAAVWMFGSALIGLIGARRRAA